MLLISNRNTYDAAINLALEEYCLKTLDPEQDYLLFYVNRSAVIIGAHQNPWEEVDEKYVKQKDIPIFRRMSGGGAVYHDTGNLNFAFITNYRKETFGRFDNFTQPIIDALSYLEITAVYAQGNCIEIDGKKISGWAQFSNFKRMLSHGTLLFSSDLNVLNRALTSKFKTVSTKAISSAKREVINVSPSLTDTITLEDLTDILIDKSASRFSRITKYELSNEAWSRIYELANIKYRAWEWVYGRSPKFVVRENHHMIGGRQPILLHVVKGIIRHVEIKTNKTPANRTSKVTDMLVGKRYDPDKVRRILRG